MPRTDVNDLTFGIELETIMPRDRNGQTGRDELARYLTGLGIECRHESYNHNARTWWKLVTDATLGYENTEVVAPILKGPEGLDEVRRTTKALEDFGCRVDRRCGAHVHVGVRDHFQGQIGFFKELVQTCSKFKPVLDSLVAPSRRTTSYAMPITWNERMARATTLRDLASAVGAGHFTNPNFWDAYTRHGTVEFRQHQGTLNPDKAENWIKLCLGLVSWASQNTERESAAAAQQRQSTTQRGDWSTAAQLNINSISGRLDRFDRRDIVITRILGYNPRRVGSQGFDAWRLYEVGCSIQAYLDRGGAMGHLRWDVQRGHIELRRNSDRQIVIVEPTPEPTPITTPVAVERPNGDHPVTLDGLMDVAALGRSERAFFAERQMELN